MEKLDYDSLPGVATELFRARQEKKEQKELEKIRPYLKSMELNGRVVCMIHAILPR